MKRSLSLPLFAIFICGSLFVLSCSNSNDNVGKPKNEKIDILDQTNFSYFPDSLFSLQALMAKGTVCIPPPDYIPSIDISTIPNCIGVYLYNPNGVSNGIVTEVLAFESIDAAKNYAASEANGTYSEIDRETEGIDKFCSGEPCNCKWSHVVDNSGNIIGVRILVYTDGNGNPGPCN